jgi:hypothetical protein
VYFDGKEYPAKDMRVEDLLGLLSRRASYPLRASSASAQERLGLSEDSASRITISGGPGLPLLDLLIGRGDETGREVYLRRQGSNEIRSGEDVFTAYTAGQRTSWYNLRLFPESENGGLDLDSVQRLSVYAGGGAEPQVFSRSGREWVLSGMEVKEADTGKIDGYVRGILNAEGEDFSNTDPSDAGFNHSRIVLETGDGNIKTLRLTEAGESGGRLAAVSGSPHAYSLASWTADRLFREASYFEKQ